MSVMERPELSRNLFCKGVCHPAEQYDRWESNNEGMVVPLVIEYRCRWRILGQSTDVQLCHESSRTFFLSFHYWQRSDHDISLTGKREAGVLCGEGGQWHDVELQ